LKNGDNSKFGGTGFLTEALANIISKTKLRTWFRYEPTDYDISVDEEFELDSLGFPGHIIHTPGHSPGSISIIIDNTIAIVGDAMFGVFRGSVFPPFAYDTKLMVESWKKLLETDCTMYLPAHGSERGKVLLKRQYEKYNKLYNL